MLDSLKSLFYSILEYFYRWPSSIIQNRVFTVYGHLANPLLPCHFHMVYEWPPRAICKRSAKRHFDLLPKLKCNLEISNRSIATEKFIFSVSWDSLIDHALCLNMTVEVACVDKKQSSEFEVREYETNFFIYLRFSSIISQLFSKYLKKITPIDMLPWSSRFSYCFMSKRDFWQTLIFLFHEIACRSSVENVLIMLPLKANYFKKFLGFSTRFDIQIIFCHFGKAMKTFWIWHGTTFGYLWLFSY